MNKLDIIAIVLTLKLAGLTTLILLLLGTPLAWWLSHYRGRFKALLQATIALPLVLPPTVLGFYLLVAFSPQNWFGSFWFSLTGQTLAFNFYGVLLGSVIYSLPFMVQPLMNGFERFGTQYSEVAATMGASPWQRFIHLVVPMCKASFISACALTFAHTIGEFGVVLMIGGNIPGETQVISIALFEHVETLQYSSAHALALGLLIFSLVLLSLLYFFNKKGESW